MIYRAGVETEFLHVMVSKSRVGRKSRNAEPHVAADEKGRP